MEDEIFYIILLNLGIVDHSGGIQVGFTSEEVGCENHSQVIYSHFSLLLIFWIRHDLQEPDQIIQHLLVYIRQQ